MKRYFLLAQIFTLWSVLCWRDNWGYIDDLPAWVRYAIKIRNEYNRLHADGWVWLKVGRLYVRNDYSYPQADIFRMSRRHLFVWKRLNIRE